MEMSGFIKRLNNYKPINYSKTVTVIKRLILLNANYKFYNTWLLLKEVYISIQMQWQTES